MRQSTHNNCSSNKLSQMPASRSGKRGGASLHASANTVAAQEPLVVAALDEAPEMAVAHVVAGTAVAEEDALKL